MAIIAGASRALKYKEEYPRDSEDKILQRITKEAETLAEKIDVEND